MTRALANQTSWTWSPGAPSCCWRRGSPCTTIQAQFLPRLGTSIFSVLFNWDLEDETTDCWLPGKINWPEAHRTKVLVLLAEESLTAPISFLTLLYSAVLTPAVLGLSGAEGNRTSLLTQTGYALHNEWASVKAIHSPQSWSLPQGASPFPSSSSWSTHQGLKFLNRDERASGLQGQAEKTEAASRSRLRPRPRSYLPISH